LLLSQFAKSENSGRETGQKKLPCDESERKNQTSMKIKVTLIFVVLSILTDSKRYQRVIVQVIFTYK